MVLQEKTNLTNGVSRFFITKSYGNLAHAFIAITFAVALIVGHHI